MNRKIIIGLLILLSINSIQTSTWEQHCKKCNRDCNSEQAQQRYEKAKERISHITEFIAKESCMMDLTQEQLKLKTQSLQTLPESQKVSSMPPHSRKLGNPSSFDWRNEGVVTSVKNQGSCGACWAFAAAAFSESKLIRDGRYSQSIDLSEQFLLSCTDSSTCSGGYMEYTMPNAKALPTETQYPYLPFQGQQDGICSALSIYVATQYYAMYDASDEQIIDVLLQYGPLAIAINSDANWIDYGGATYSCADTSDRTVNHAVLLVGYDADSWTIKNQWGQEWGIDGYMKITRDRLNNRNCGIGLATHLLDGTPETETFQHNWEINKFSYIVFMLLSLGLIVFI